MVDYYTKTEIDDFFEGKTSSPVKQEVDWIRSLVNKPVVDVKEYGAKGDGSTDDLQAFKDARDSLTSGGILYVPPGTYILSNTLTIDEDSSSNPLNNIQIIGAGRDATIIKHKGSVAAFVLISVTADTPDTRDNIRIAHLTLDGNKSTLTGDGKDVLEFVRARFFLVEDVKIINASLNSIYINGNNDGTAIDENAGIIENIWSHSPNATHVMTGKKLKYLTIKSLCGYNSGTQGISITGTTNKSSVGVDVLGCRLFSSGVGDPGGSGIHVYAPEEENDHWGYHKIVYNEIYKSGSGGQGQGILVSGHHGTIVAFNHIWDSKENNINIAKSDNCTVIGNICHGTEGSDSYDGSGILTGRSAGCTHLGNVCFDNNLSGIGLVGSNNCLINGNTCKNNGQLTNPDHPKKRAGIHLNNCTQLNHDEDCFNNVVSGNVCVDDQGTETQIYGISEETRTVSGHPDTYVGRSLINNNKVHGDTKTILLETDNDGKDSETHNNQTIDNNYGLTAADPLTLPDDRDTFKLNASDTVSIDEIKPSWIGRIVTFTFQNDKVTLIDNPHLRLQGNNDFDGDWSNTIQLMCWGDYWFEVSRSENKP